MKKLLLILFLCFIGCFIPINRIGSIYISESNPMRTLRLYPPDDEHEGVVYNKVKYRRDYTVYGTLVSQVVIKGKKSFDTPIEHLEIPGKHSILNADNNLETEK